MKLHLLACSVLALAACGGAKPKTTDPTTTTPPADAVLAIGELKFYAGDKLGMHLHADGKLEAATGADDKLEEVALVKTDGTITAGGKTARFGADGSLSGPNGETAPFKLDGATLVAGDKRVTIDDKGNVLINGAVDKDAKALRIEGATSAPLQRTALVLLALMMTGDSHDEATPAPATPPAK
jgi:hypothetical protein